MMIFSTFQLCMVMIFLFTACAAPSEQFFLRTKKGEQLLFDKNHNSATWKKINDYFKKEAAPLVTDDMGERLWLETSSGIKFPARFFDRGSNNVIVLGQGFGDAKELWNATIALFHGYNIIVFDYRWRDFLTYITTLEVMLNPIKKLVEEPMEEVIAVVHYLRQQGYQEIIGLAECYSTYTFAAAQVAEQENDRQLFDKLIFDSTWLSIKDMGSRTHEDLYLKCNNREGGAPTWLKSVLHYSQIKTVMIALTHMLFANQTIENVLRPFTHNVPVLFIHGKKDLIVPQDAFEQIWRAVTHDQKVAIMTPYEHVRSRTNRSIYKYCCDCFIGMNFADFIAHLQLDTRSGNL